MIGIGGLARAGKDTLADCMAKIIEEEYNTKVKVYSFANAIKSQINDFLVESYGISAFSQNTEEKQIIRDLLVCHGETMKKIHGKTIWAEIVIDEINQDDKSVFPIIPDVRFDFEVASVQQEEGVVLHIAKQGNKPPNKIEATNDPLVQKSSDLCHTWPTYEPDKMEECMGHAEILWQMIDPIYKERWKKIYI